MPYSYHRLVGDWEDKLYRALHFAGEVVAETLWPTRCALCDMPGAVLCERCARAMPHVDWWQACQRCGSPFGRVQCDACNPVALSRLMRKSLPFSQCASAVVFDERTGRLVRVFKDQGEQRLSRVMADAMVRMVGPSWEFDAVTFVPATLAAARYRGFDHAQLVARDVASALDVSCVETLARPKTRDQRKLTGTQRVANLAGSFHALDKRPPNRVLLVDDVYTTGATLCAATDALLAAGCLEVRCLTFARV